jgi:glutamine cyclotransferase
MHLIQPNTKYRIVTVELAVPDSVEYWTDGMNEMLNQCLQTTQQSGELFIADWQILNNEREVTSSATPEEGELFGDGLMHGPG